MAAHEAVRNRDSGSTAGEGATLILYGGSIVTLDARIEGATAIAVRGERVLAVGDDATMLALAHRGTERIPLEGRTVIPGLIESHAHLLGLGLVRQDLDLRSLTKSREAILGAVRERAAVVPRGQWIRGFGWDQNQWEGRELPTLAELSQAAPHNPVYLSRIDGHAAWVNAAALTATGVGPDSIAPRGGRVEMTRDGRLQGIFVDQATQLITAKMPPRSAAEERAAIALAMQEAARLGITMLHDAGASRRTIDTLKDLGREGRLLTRLYVMLDGSDPALLEDYWQRGPELGLYGDRLTIRTIKLFADGALGSRGAALFEDYNDCPGNRGLLLMDGAAIEAIARRALDRGFQVATHAIGDRANRIVLDAYEAAFAGDLVRAKQARFRVEHAQILQPDDIGRFALMGVIASVQTSHFASDAPWVEARIGASRCRHGAYAWRELLDSGAHLVNGSDAPIEGLNPMAGLVAAIRRGGFGGEPDGRVSLTREEALRSYTSAGAYASFLEAQVGTISPGKWADLAVLNRNIRTACPEEVLGTRVELTIMGGQVVWSA